MCVGGRGCRGFWGKGVRWSQGPNGFSIDYQPPAHPTPPKHPWPYPTKSTPVLPLRSDLTSFVASLSLSLLITLFYWPHLHYHHSPPSPSLSLFIRLDAGDSWTLLVSRFVFPLVFSPDHLCSPPLPLMQHKIHYWSHYIKIRPRRIHTLSLSCTFGHDEDIIHRECDGLAGSSIHPFIETERLQTL